MKRRVFFKRLIWLGITGLLISWGDMVKKAISHASNQKRIINTSDISNGLNIFENVIIFRKDHLFKVMSSRCTHLGCHISHVEGDELVCPCHGSRFDTEGNNLKGPASSPLQPLDFENVKNSKLIIHLS